MFAIPVLFIGTMIAIVIVLQLVKWAPKVARRLKKARGTRAQRPTRAPRRNTRLSRTRTRFNRWLKKLPGRMIRLFFRLITWPFRALWKAFRKGVLRVWLHIIDPWTGGDWETNAVELTIGLAEIMSRPGAAVSWMRKGRTVIFMDFESKTTWTVYRSGKVVRQDNSILGTYKPNKQDTQKQEKKQYGKKYPDLKDSRLSWNEWTRLIDERRKSGNQNTNGASEKEWRKVQADRREAEKAAGQQDMFEHDMSPEEEQDYANWASS